MPSANFEIKYGTKRHRKILDALMERRRLSEDEMCRKYSKWAKDEELHAAYVNETETDAERRVTREDGFPQFTTLHIPLSYAILMAAHTYDTTVFLARDPILQFQGRHGESEQQVHAIEALMNYQVHVGEGLVPLYIWLLDRRKYGVAFLGIHWDEEVEVVSRIEEEPVFYGERFFGKTIPIVGKTKKVRKSEQIPGYMGNRLFNIRPQDAYPDPRVPLNMLHKKGEFFAWRSNASWTELAKKHELDEIFNYDQLEKMQATGATTREEGGQSEDLPEVTYDPQSEVDLRNIGTRELITMVVELIPKEWDLHSRTYPEKWVFTYVEDKVIIEARPLGAYHNKFPVAIMEHEPDGYEFLKRSMGEIQRPLNDTMDWLINTHFYNVRKVLNDQFLVDPSLVVMKDVLDPGAGKLIRLRPKAYGRMHELRAIEQLRVTDVTQQHLSDSQLVLDMMQRLTGVNDNIMGLLNTGGRKSATEVRSSNAFGVSRLKTENEYASAQGWWGLSQMMLQNTQQYYELERVYRVAGSNVMPGIEQIQVGPESIQGFFDFIPVDGTMPVDRFAQANLWGQLFAQMRNFPEIMQQYDMAGVFGWVAQLAGLKNIKQFRLNVVPDQQLSAQVQAGNVVRPRNPEIVPEPGQVPGVGPTG